MLNKSSYSKKDQWVGDFFASVSLEEASSSCSWIVTLAYGPNDSRQKSLFWSELDSIRNRRNAPWCIGGDWNVVRFPSERSVCNLLTSDIISLSLV